MSDQHSILQALLTAQADEAPVALATVVRARGSVPRHAGSKLLVYENGRLLGTVGGGEMESRVITEAQAALADGQPRMLPYALIDPQRGDPGVCGGEMEIFIEPYLPPATLFIIGCGHVGRAVAAAGKQAGFRIAVTDDREALVTPEHIPAADSYLPGHMADVLQQFHITRQTYIVGVTRNINVDRQVLPLLLDSPAAYIGLMGSRRRWSEAKALLIADGVSEEALARVRSPLGLELNAETPEEIAVSILAEIIMLRRGGNGPFNARMIRLAKHALQYLN